MRVDKFGQILYDTDEIFDIVMKCSSKIGSNQIGPFLIDDDNLDIESINKLVGYKAIEKYHHDDVSVEEFDKKRQECWFMPDSYKEMDIVQYILDLCNNETEKQRCAEELLLYVERDLLDLLKYIKYLVDVMELNNIIWGVGRGSSVSSFVLYKLKLHRIDSIYYQLDPKEFLR